MWRNPLCTISPLLRLIDCLLIYTLYGIISNSASCTVTRDIVLVRWNFSHDLKQFSFFECPIYFSIEVHSTFFGNNKLYGDVNITFTTLLPFPLLQHSTCCSPFNKMFLLHSAALLLHRRLQYLIPPPYSSDALQHHKTISCLPVILILLTIGFYYKFFCLYRSLLILRVSARLSLDSLQNLFRELYNI